MMREKYIQLHNKLKDEEMGLFLAFKASYSSVVLINASCFGGQRAKLIEEKFVLLLNLKIV